VIEHCEVAYSATNAFELSGGNADLRHLSALFARSASLRVDGGCRARVQFLFAALGANGSQGVWVGPPSSPAGDPATGRTSLALHSATILGGGALGRSIGSLLHLARDVTGTFDGLILAHSAGKSVSYDGEWALPPPPPPGPPAVFATSLQHVGFECGNADYGADGFRLELESEPSLSMCADAAGARHSSAGDCATFQYAADVPIWGCICCGPGASWRPSTSVWSLYSITATPPPLPQLPWLFASPPQPPTLPSSRAGDVFLAPGSITAGDPGLIRVDASCLTLPCLEMGGFDPLPAPGGAACRAPVLQVSDAFFTPVPCAGAFSSPHYLDNWVAGWSVLFPQPLGVNATRPIQISMQNVSSYTTTIDVSVLQASASEADSHWFTKSIEQCRWSGYASTGPHFWARLVAMPAAHAELSTCTPDGAGFDTDLTVFQLVSEDVNGLVLEQVACNGDAFDDGTCQPLYSRLSFAADGSSDYLVAISRHHDSRHSRRYGSTMRAQHPRAVSAAPPYLPCRTTN
jgi:hypothetical protein